MSDNVTTWADGFGVWHARVPEGVSAAHIARKAIRDEIEAREAAPLAPIYLRRVIDADSVAGTVVYAEVERWTAIRPAPKGCKD